MPCFLALLAVFFPRIVIVLLMLFTTYFRDPYQTIIWPILGLIFLPFTTLVYAFAYHGSGGHISGIYLVIVVLAVLMDLGAWGGGGATTRRRRWR